MKKPTTIEPGGSPGAQGQGPGAYQDLGVAPVNAQIVNPLSGSALMREDAGKIWCLFPPMVGPGEFTDGGNAVLRIRGKVIPAGLTRVGVSADGFAVVSAGFNSGNFFVRALKNNVEVLGWVNPFPVRVESHVVPDSTAPATTFVSANPSDVPIYAAAPYKFNVSFDALEIFSVLGNQAIQIMFWSGNASLDFQ